MAIYPAPKRIPQFFDPSDWDTAGREEYLKLSGGTVTGSINLQGGGSYRLGNQIALTQTAGQIVGTLGSLNVSGNVTASTSGLIANQTFRTFTKSLEIFQNNFSHICDITGSNAYGFDLTVAQSVSGASICKYYTGTMQFNNTGGNWRRLIPLSSSGPSSGRDWAVDINVSNSLAQLRLVRTDATGGVTGLAGFSCSIYVRNSIAPVIVTDNATVGLDATSSGIYENTLLTQVDGRVGVGTDAPSTSLDVAGDINASGNVIGSGLLLNSSMRQIYNPTVVAGTSLAYTNGSAIGYLTNFGGALKIVYGKARFTWTAVTQISGACSISLPTSFFTNTFVFIPVVTNVGVIAYQLVSGAGVDANNVNFYAYQMVGNNTSNFEVSFLVFGA